MIFEMMSVITLLQTKQVVDWLNLICGPIKFSFICQDLVYLPEYQQQKMFKSSTKMSLRTKT